MKNNHIDLNKLSDFHINLYRKIYKNSSIEFNNFIEELMVLNLNINLLISHPLFSRNNYLSSFYEDFCLLKLVIYSYKDDEKFIIKLSNYRQYLLLNDYFKEKSNIVFDYPRSNQLKNLLRQIKVFFKMFIFLIYMKIIGFFISNNNKKNINLISINFIESMFSNNSFKDRYYNGIDQELEKEEFFFYPIFLLKKNIYKKIKILNQSKYKIIFIYKYINIFDVLKIQFYFLNFLKINFACKNSYFKNYLKYYFRENLIDSNTYLSFINYYSIKNLYKSRFKINKMIVWYENQPMEKGLVYALNKFYPNCSIKGYKSYFVDNNFHFYIRPTNYEYSNNYIPKLILTVSYHDQKDLNKYCNDIKILAGPLLRFNHLQKIKTITKPNNYKILVSLPIHLDESINILKLINKFIKLDNKYSFFVKPHPFLNFKDISNYIADPNIQLTDISNEELFNKCFSIISNTSSIILEAFLAGMDIIVSTYKRKNIQNPLYFLDESYYLEINDPQKLQIHYENFSPISEENILKEKIQINDFTKNKSLL